MPAVRVTKTLVSRIKRDAKRRSRESTISHAEALEDGARHAGFADWYSLCAAVDVAPPSSENPLPIDPVLPSSFYDTPNEERPASEIDLWWDRPYLVTRKEGFDVRCLDGGAWDRPTFYGVAPDLEAAVVLARDKLATWLKYRETPTATILGDGRWAAVLLAQRPGDDDKLLFAGERPEDVQAWLVGNNYVGAG